MSHTDPPADPLAALLTDEHVVPRLRAASKPALLAELARRAAVQTGHGEAGLAASLAAREALGSTGVGAGIAVPHARIDGLPGVFGLFARLEKPVPFEAIDGRPVDLVFLLLSPSRSSSEHLSILAAVSRRLRDAALADAIRSAGSADVIRLLLTSRPDRV